KIIRMNYLQTNQISKSYGVRTLFTNLNISINYGDKIALIARNGYGKSTLMRILAGVENADEGKVILRSGLKIGYLSQDQSFDPEKNVREIIFQQDNEVTALIGRYENAIQHAQNEDLDFLLSEMDRLSAWDFESRIKNILGKLKLDNLEAQVSTLSVGQK